MCKNENVELKHLKVGDTIRFYDDSGVQEHTATIKSMSDNYEIEFENGWGINGLCIWDIKIL
jgi:hypothetical protein